MQNDRLIALDMDGVVVDGMKYHLRAWQMVIKQHLDREVSDQRINITEGYKGEQVIAELSQEWGLNLTPMQQQRIFERKKEVFDRLFRIEAVPGAQEMVAGLAALGYPLALVTGTERAVAENVLVTLGVRKYFSLIVSGEDTALGKPHPQPYLKAAESLGFPPVRCLVIENAPAGIAAARAAKMACLAVETSLDASFLAEATQVVKDVRQALGIVQAEHELSDGVGEWLLPLHLPVMG